MQRWVQSTQKRERVGPPPHTGAITVLLRNANWDSLAESCGKFLAKCQRWSPIGQDVSFTIDDSDDHHLVGKSVSATVRAHDHETGMLLMQLCERISYEGHYTARDLAMIVAVPAIRWNRAQRLLISWTVVRLVDAPSFALQGFGRTIGTGRLVLVRAAKFSKQVVCL